MDMEFIKKVGELADAHGVKAMLIVVHAERGGCVALCSNIQKEEALARLSMNLSDGMKHYPQVEAIVDSAYNMEHLVRKFKKEGGNDVG